MKGMKKLALLGGNEAYSVTKSRYQGFIQAHNKFGVPFMDELVVLNADIQLKVTEAVTKAL